MQLADQLRDRYGLAEPNRPAPTDSRIVAAQRQLAEHAAVIAQLRDDAEQRNRLATGEQQLDEWQAKRAAEHRDILDQYARTGQRPAWLANPPNDLADRMAEIDAARAAQHEAIVVDVVARILATLQATP